MANKSFVNPMRSRGSGKIAPKGPSMPKPPKPNSAPPATSGMSKALPEERRYRAEDALRTIARADQHKADGGLMRDVKHVATEHAKAAGCYGPSSKGDKY